MDLKKSIEKINKKELVKIFSNQYMDNASLEKKRKMIFTIDKFEVFFRLYVDKNIQVYIRTNTINSKEKVKYTFVDFNTLKITDINEYKRNIRAFYKNLIKEVNWTLYCPEHHNEMTPSNATEEELKNNGWCVVYEKRLLTELNYNDMDKFKEWLEKVTDKKYKIEQKSI